MLEGLFGWLGDYTLRTVAMGSALLGVVTGVLGSFALLRRQSLLGDALSHAALPGICVAFLITRSKTPLVLILGAGVAAWIGALLISAVIRTTRIKTDAAMGVVLSVFFGAGLVLLTYIQRLPEAGKAGLDKFLFGQAAALVERDVVTMAVLGGFALAAVALFWKEFKLLTFDPGFAAALGFPVRALDAALTTLLVIAIVIGLQAVGVVLMSALVVAPAAAARQWTDRLGAMVVIAAAAGGISGGAGALVSSTTRNLPTGPTIAVLAILLVAVSMLFAPHRGLLVAWLRGRRTRRRMRSDVLLIDLYMLSLHHDEEHPHPTAAIAAMRPGLPSVGPSLEELADRGLVVERPDGWVITADGRGQAKRLLDSEGGLEAELATTLAEGAQ
jgi:manganese/zinc/iron transport system permease protein